MGCNYRVIHELRVLTRTYPAVMYLDTHSLSATINVNPIQIITSFREENKYYLKSFTCAEAEIFTGDVKDNCIKRSSSATSYFSFLTVSTYRYLLLASVRSER